MTRFNDSLIEKRTLERRRRRRLTATLDGGGRKGLKERESFSVV
jgi:hypothetical protein